MRVHTLLGAATLFFAFLGGSVASAADCTALKQINSIDLIPGPNRALVPVTLNGVSKLFLLDTGGDVSGINGATAKELNLTELDSNLKMLDLYGNASKKFVRIAEFTIGRQKGTDLNMIIEPNPDFGKGTRYVGIFAADLMGRYDVELDFGAGKMNYFSPDHCEGHVVYWQPTALAVVPIKFLKRHIRLPVKLDGHELRAEIDTGSTGTNMTAAAAKRVFDIEPETQGNVSLHAHDMPGIFGHIFSTLDFEGVAVANPHIAIRPALVGSKDANNGLQTGSFIKHVDDLDDQPDLLIGMDILKKLHLYIAFDERNIYISPATPPAALSPAALRAVDGISAPREH